MKRSATAVWKGGIKDGTGEISTQSGVLSNSPYGFKTRFENEPGTNPEELIGAAHAGCFSMALSMILGGRGRQGQLPRVEAAQGRHHDGPHRRGLTGQSR